MPHNFVIKNGSPDFMVISKTYCFGSRESGVGSRKKEHPKIVYLDTFYHKMSGEPFLRLFVIIINLTMPTGVNLSNLKFSTCPYRDGVFMSKPAIFII
jgi:hypothetical protein